MLRPRPRPRGGEYWWLMAISVVQVLLSGSDLPMAAMASVTFGRIRGISRVLPFVLRLALILWLQVQKFSRVVDRLGSPRMDELLDDAREQWDLILFDAPPALAAGDALTIASKADGAVLLVHAGQDERGLLVRLANAVKQAGSEVFGVVLNQARMESGGYFKKNFRIMRDYSEVA